MVTIHVCPEGAPEDYARARAWFGQQGHRLPAEAPRVPEELPEPQRRRFALGFALATLLDAEAICVLPGWQKSVLAHLQYQVAVALGIPVWEFDAVLGRPTRRKK